MKSYEILFDTSEKKPWVFEKSDRCSGSKRVNLFTGDYSLAGLYDNKYFVIEKKASVVELVGNLTNKEKWDDFKQELERLEEFTHPFVICEFPFKQLLTYPVGSTLPKWLWKKTKITPQFLMLRMQEIFLHFRSKWLFLDSPDMAKAFVSGLFKRVTDEFVR